MAAKKNIMSDNSNNPQLNQLVSFIQHDLPGLDAGKYQLLVQQDVKDAEGKTVSDDTLTTTYNFAVTGDRFGLKKPGEMIYSVFPAANATGKYNAVLPSVVLTKTKFPWSRIPNNTLNEELKKLEPGQDVDEDVSTWLTIILLDEDDVTAYANDFPAFALQPANATIGDLFETDMNAQSTLGTNCSYFSKKDIDKGKPMSDFMDAGDQVTDNIQVIDIPLPLFWKIAPTIDDLKMMAHVRKVSLLNKPTMPGISDVGEPEGSFSIVFGNRLPGANKKTFAYLVSLEEMEDFLPSAEEGGPPTATAGKADKLLRLAVLTSWTFYSVGDSAGFISQLNALNNAAPPVGQNVNATLQANTNLRLTAPDTALPIVKNALTMGYVPLNHQLRSGEINNGVVTVDKTVSWYRGPLTPYLISNASVTLPVASPDQATIFDPTTGLLDVSYSAAWTLGRQLALQDKGFATALYNWKKGLTQDVINNAEQQLLAQQFSAAFTPVAEKATLMLNASPAASQENMMLEATPVNPIKQRRKPKPAAGSFMLKSILAVNSKKQ
jgi:hypothetical protein